MSCACNIPAAFVFDRIVLRFRNEATLLQSQTNYDYNKALEDAGNGIKKGNYVYDQTDTRTDGCFQECIAATILDLLRCSECL